MMITILRDKTEAIDLSPRALCPRLNPGIQMLPFFVTGSILLAEVGAENNSTTVLMIPSDFVTLSKTLSEYLRELASAPK